MWKWAGQSIFDSPLGIGAWPCARYTRAMTSKRSTASTQSHRDTGESALAWDRYWSYGHLHSFSQVASGNYAGAVAEFWDSIFSELPDGSRILDVATGNGALPLLALDTADHVGRSFTVHGADIAAIAPTEQVSDPAVRERLAAIDFHPRTPAESLPFDDGAFDLVTSQFGLEYSDLDQSTSELVRVLRPGGRLALVVHHQDSAAVTAARAEMAQLDFVLDDNRLFLKARNLLRARAENKAGKPSRNAKEPPKVARKRKTLDDAINRIERAGREQANNRMLLGPLNYVREVFAVAERNGAREALDWLDEARQRVEASRERLRAMQAAARSESDMASLSEILTAAGTEPPKIGALHETNGELVGWQLTTQRTPTTTP